VSYFNLGGDSRNEASSRVEDASGEYAFSKLREAERQSELCRAIPRVLFKRFWCTRIALIHRSDFSENLGVAIDNPLGGDQPQLANGEEDDTAQSRQDHEDSQWRQPLGAPYMPDGW
jgi:hypothetical protein